MSPIESSRAVDWLDDLPVVGKNKTAVVAETTATSPTTPAVLRIHEAKQAVVRVLDKQTNRVQQLTLSLKQVHAVGTLSVSINRCLLDSNGKPGLDAGWLEVRDSSLPDRGFNGWMFSRYPQAATLDNPRYDVQLASCVLPAGEQRIQAAAPPAGAGQGTGGEDVEGGGDDEAPAGGGGGNTSHSSDPFFVPGVNGAGGGDGAATSTSPASNDNDNAQVGEPTGEKPARAEQVPASENGADAGVDVPTEATPARRERGGDQQQLQQMMDGGGGGGQ